MTLPARLEVGTRSRMLARGWGAEGCYSCAPAVAASCSLLQKYFLLLLQAWGYSISTTRKTTLFSPRMMSKPV